MVRITTWLFLAILIGTFTRCQPPATQEAETGAPELEEAPPKEVYEDRLPPELSLEQANRLAALPMKCIQNPLPYKSGIVVASEEDLAMPQEHHPAFYGCFDWHSAVHGHWVLVNLLRHFPELNHSDSIRVLLDQNLSAANIQTEIEYFSLNKYSRNFERTYGWAWLLKLCEELSTWDDPDAKKWSANLKPLADVLVEKYKEYLPKLTYPLRIGTHSNTAFGLTFAWDYCNTTGHDTLKALIESRARDFYLKDQGCPLAWEPSGYDFLSPCLEEADLMRRVLPEEEFNQWFAQFLAPLMETATNPMTPAQVSDRSDGHLVYLDGLNFSRAWCLYPIARHHPKWEHLRQIADEHLAFSLPNIVDGDYMGEHWLASFALNALNEKSGD